MFREFVPYLKLREYNDISFPSLSLFILATQCETVSVVRASMYMCIKKHHYCNIVELESFKSKMHFTTSQPLCIDLL